MCKNGSRANWGVLVSAGSATNVATLVVTPKNCTTLTYTGVDQRAAAGTRRRRRPAHRPDRRQRRGPDDHLHLSAAAAASTP